MRLTVLKIVSGFQQAVNRLGLTQPANAHVTTVEYAVRAKQLVSGYPLVVRPSYVLGGWMMEIV
jgi:carbamoyl-phosphate synthase large subunit